MIHSKLLYTISKGLFSGFDAPTVWSEFTPLANANKAVNLGQGFPDWATPDFAKKALIEVTPRCLKMNY